MNRQSEAFIGYELVRIPICSQLEARQINEKLANFLFSES